MSNTSLTTGAIALGVRNIEKKTPQASGGHFHILLVGDFSGRASRGDHSLNTCSPIVVDRDNFSEVFNQLRVRVQLPISETPLEFADFDDLHPDFLVENLTLFDSFKALKNRLKKPEHFASALAQLQTLGVYTASHSDKNEAATPPDPSQQTDHLLDAIFANTTSTQNINPLADIDQFIRHLVAPYAQAKLDPRLPEVLAAVDTAMAQSLQHILHHSAFQEVEANWRSLYFLVRRLNTNSRLKLFILDASIAALEQDALNFEDVVQTRLHKILVENYQTPGKIPFSCIQTQFYLQDNVQQLQLAANLAYIAGSLGAISIIGGSEKLAGCASLFAQPDSSDWSYPVNQDFKSAWQTLRSSELGHYLAVAAPRFLLRLPYGKKTSPIEAFDFNELAESNPQAYLWGNSATLVSLVLGESFSRLGAEFTTRISSQIDQLPVHAFEQDGVSQMTPCAEIAILDSAVARLTAEGMLVVRSIFHKNAVLIPVLRTVHCDGSTIFQR